MAHPKPEHTRAALIAAAKELAARLGTERLSLSTFCAETKTHSSRVYARFGTWGALCTAAGLRTVAVQVGKSHDQLLADLHAAVMEAGGLGNRDALIRAMPHSAQLFRSRFGSWGATLHAYRNWVAAHAPDFPYGNDLEARITRAVRRKDFARLRDEARAAPGDDGALRRTDTLRPPWRSVGARASGPPFAFRAMASAPANEMGVVLLFGMVAAELGYAVDAIGSAFPDCAARRIVADGVSDADTRWEQVRIEFEYRSRSFLDHRHDADGCDIIVCWQHDWPDCPIEVLELSAVVDLLRAP